MQKKVLVVMYMLFASWIANTQVAPSTGIAFGNNQGTAVLLSGATVQVCTTPTSKSPPCDTPATIYLVGSDGNCLGTAVVSGQLTTGTDGTYAFCALPGTYAIESTSAYFGLVRSYGVIGGTTDATKLPLAGGTLTGPLTVPSLNVTGSVAVGATVSAPTINTKGTSVLFSGNKTGVSGANNYSADNGAGDRHSFNLRDTSEWDAAVNPYFSGGALGTGIPGTKAMLARAINSPTILQANSFVVQGVLRFSMGNNTGNYIGVTSAPSGTLETTASQHAYVGFTSAGFVYNRFGTIVPLTSSLANQNYVVTLASIGGVSTASIVPYGGTAGAQTFTYTTMGASLSPLNFQVEMTSAYDSMQSVRYVDGGGSTYTLDVPMDAGGGNSATVIELDLASVKTWAIIPPSYRPGVQSSWVLYDHGYMQSGLDISNNAHDNLLMDALVQAGYVVVASDYTSKSCWGNSTCVADISAVQSQWRSYLNLAPQPYVIAESMGGAVTFNAISKGTLNPRAMVGIYPVLNLASLYAQVAYAPSIQVAYGFSGPSGYAAATAGSDPILDAPTTFASFPILIWASYGDNTVTRSLNADPFAAAVNAAGGNVVVNTSTGDHGDISNFNPQAVIDFFAAH